MARPLPSRSRRPAGCFLDGCKAGSDIPLEAIVTRWRRAKGDPIAALLLTHPHSDHCEGLPELIESLHPSTIGITACEPPSESLLFEATLLSRRAGATNERLRADAVRAAIIAIERWHEENPNGLLRLHDGTTLPLAPSSASALVRAPDHHGLAAFLAAHDLEGRLRRHANHISAVVEIRHGDAHVVLGGDLPRFWPGGKRAITTGWDHVMARYPELGTHGALKIPHHGSRDAHHPDLMTAADTERAWCVTPYNSSRLPRVAAGDGISLLLEKEPSVHLTAIPAAKAVQAEEPLPGRVPITSLRRRTALQPTGDPFLDEGIDIRPGSACGSLDAVWCFALDRDGRVRGRWHGSASIEVVRSSEQ